MLKRYTKQDLLNALLPVVQMTRDGSNVKELNLMDNETVEIVIRNGYCYYVNIAIDSGMAIIRDVCKKIG